MKNISRLTGLYTLKELALYLKSIREVLGKEPLSQPIVITLEACFSKKEGESLARHAIEIGYNPKNNPPWYFMDPDKQIEIESVDEASLVEKIMQVYLKSGVKENSSLAMASYIQTANNQAKEIETRFTQLSESSDWEQIHNITAEKQEAFDSAGRSLLFMAILSEDFKTLNNLLNRGVNAEKLYGEGDAIAMQLIKRDQVKVLEILLIAQQINPNVISYSGAAFGFTPLTYAISLGREDMVNLLLKHGANITLKDENGKRPIDYATESKNGKIKSLIQTQASLQVEQPNPVEKAFGRFMNFFKTPAKPVSPVVTQNLQKEQQQSSAPTLTKKSDNENQ